MGKHMYPRKTETQSTSKGSFLNIGTNLKTYASNKYIRFINWYQKPYPTIASKGAKIVSDFQDRSSKNEITEKIKELIQLLKDY